MLIKKYSQIIRKWIVKNMISLLRYGWMPPHTSLFVKKKSLQ